jgi:hypothetical protein
MGASIGEGLNRFIIGFEDYEELIRIRRASRRQKRIVDQRLTDNKIIEFEE